jgi:hypothetical protein
LLEKMGPFLLSNRLLCLQFSIWCLWFTEWPKIVASLVSSHCSSFFSGNSWLISLFRKNKRKRNYLLTTQWNYTTGLISIVTFINKLIRKINLTIILVSECPSFNIIINIHIYKDPSNSLQEKIHPSM